MPGFISPSRSQIHTNTPLTNISIAFFQQQSNFIANNVFPIVPVPKSTNVFYTIPRGELNRLEVKQRSRGAKPALTNHNVERDTYDCQLYALGEAITDEDRADTDVPLNLETQVTQLLTTQGMIQREQTWVNQFFTTGIWTTDITGVASSPTGNQVLQWGDDASTPIEDVEDGKTAILASTGFMPNTLVLGHRVYARLRNHPDIVDRINRGQTPGSAAVTDEQVLAQVFGVERVMVSKAIINSAQEGATAAHDFIAPNRALLCYVAPNPGLRIPTAGYTFGWNVYSGVGMRIRNFRDEPSLSDVIVMDDAYDQKLISADLGYFFTNIVQ